MRKNNRMNPLEHTPPLPSCVIAIQPLPKGTHRQNSCYAYYEGNRNGGPIFQDGKSFLEGYAQYVGEGLGFTSGWYSTSDYGWQLKNGQIFVKVQLSDFAPLYGYISIFDIHHYWINASANMLYIAMNSGALIPTAGSWKKIFIPIANGLDFYDPEGKQHNIYPGLPIQFWGVPQEMAVSGRIPEQPVIKETLYTYIGQLLDNYTPSNIWSHLKGEYKRLEPTAKQIKETEKIRAKGRKAAESGETLPTPQTHQKAQPAGAETGDAQFWKQQYEKEHQKNKMLLQMLNDETNGDIGRP